MKDNYKNIIDNIKATRKLELFFKFLNGSIISIGFGASLFLIFAIFELLFNLSTTGRTILFFLNGIVLLSVFFYFSFNSLLKFIGLLNDEKLETTAFRIGNYYPEIKDKLSNALQLYPLIANTRGNSSDLTRAAFNTIAEETKKYNFKKIIETDKIKKNTIKSSIPVILLFLLLFIFPDSYGNASYRLLNFSTSFIPPAPFEIEIEKEYDEIIRGDNAIINILSKGNAPETIELHIKEGLQENFDIIKLNLDSGKYSYKIPSAKNSLQYFGKAYWVGSAITTETGKISVIEMPIIKSLSGKLNYPGYTGIPTRVFSEKDADISALIGSRVNINIVSNKIIDNASLIYNSVNNVITDDSSFVTETSDTIPFLVDIDNPAKATIHFRVNSSGTYFIKIKDEDGKYNQNPIEYGILALEDNYPSVSLNAPINDVQLDRDALLPINVEINDDFGFSSLKLYYKLVESKFVTPEKDYSSVKLDIPSGKLSANIFHIWNLNEIDITPEDKYEFYLEVADNDIVNGPKKSKTQILTVRLPSLEEILSSSDQKQNEINKDLKELMTEADELNKEMADFNRDMLKKNKNEKLNWEEKKKAEDIMKKQKELREKFDDLREELQQTTEKLQNNNAISEETLRKYQELQRLMQEVNSPELDRMNQMMQQAMDNMSPQEMQKAMEEFKFNEEQFRKSIERTKKILERMKAEQKIDALQKLAEEMVKEQQEIMNETEQMKQSDSQKADELKQRQNELSDQVENIQNELEDLEKLMENLEDETLPMEQLDNAEQALNKEQTQSEMKNANQQMNSDKKQSQQSQQNAKNNLEEFAQQMQELKNQMEQMSSQQAINQMEKSINDLLKLSQDQENIKNQSANTTYNSTKIPEIAREQSSLQENLNNVARQMSELSEKSFAVTPEMGKEITNAMKNMNEAMSQMQDRRMNKVAEAQSGAMQNLNNAIGQMQQMLGAMKEQGNGTCPNPGGQGQGQGQGKGQSGMSFSQQMQQMAAQQQMLNQQMQQMSGMGQSGGMSQEERAEMGRLAEKQGQAKQSLEELAEQEKNNSGGEKSKAKELQDIAKEMEEVIRDINNNNVSPETLEKQERILSRLLDATKSIHERDFEKQRESKEGKKFDINSPDFIDFENERLKQALNDLLNQNKLKYSKDYEILIKKYFNQIQQNQNKSKE